MPIINPTLPNDGETADAGDVSIPLTAILSLINGGLDADNFADLAIVAGKIADLAVTGAKIANNTIDINAKALIWDGWIQVTDTWSYASATTVTVPTNATTKYAVGDFVKFTQGGTAMYFTVQAVAATLLTLRPIGSSTLTNVTISAINYSKARNPQGLFSAGGGNDWQELGRTTLTAPTDTISVASFAPRKYLKALVHLYATNGTINAAFRYNGDAGNNYGERNSTNGGADASGTSTNLNTLLPTTSANPAFLEATILNIQNQEKLLRYYTTSRGSAGAANLVDRKEGSAKWANTSAQITTLDCVNITGTGDFDIGSEVIVFGRN